MGLRKQLFDRIGQQVGRGVTDHFQAFGIFGGDDGQTRIAVHGVAGVNHFAIHLASQGGFGQACAYGSCYVGHAHWAGKFTLRTVGESNLNHVSSSKKARQWPRLKRCLNAENGFYAALALGILLSETALLQ